MAELRCWPAQARTSAVHLILKVLVWVHVCCLAFVTAKHAPTNDMSRFLRPPEHLCSLRDKARSMQERPGGVVPSVGHVACGGGDLVVLGRQERPHAAPA